MEGRFKTWFIHRLGTGIRVWRPMSWLIPERVLKKLRICGLKRYIEAGLDDISCRKKSETSEQLAG